MRSIAAFFVTATIGSVFCSVLQQRDTKLPQQTCFSNGNWDIATLQKLHRNKYIILIRCYNSGREKRCNMQDVAVFCMIAAIRILFVAPFLNYSDGLDRCNRPLNFPAPKFPSIFFAFLIKDLTVNYTRLAWKLACMLRT